MTVTKVHILKFNFLVFIKLGMFTLKIVILICNFVYLLNMDSHLLLVQSPLARQIKLTVMKGIILLI
jgi:hypothetical protein